MSRISLRQLAKQYADGSLDQESYRRARADYLDAVLQGDTTPGALTQASYTSPKAVAGEETVTAATLHDKEQQQKLSEEDPAPAEHLQTRPIQLTDHSYNRVFVSVGIIAGMLVLIIAAGMLFGGGDDVENSDSGNGEVAASVQQTEPAPMQPLESANSNAALAQLKEFVDTPQWDQQALDDFVSRWQALPQEQRDTALQTTLARQLSDALYRQLLEERALQSLDNGEAASLAGQKKIVNFARNIGLEDRRLEVEAAN